MSVSELFRDVTKSLVDDVDFNLKNIDDKNFLECVASSVLRGAMTGITENPALFIRGYSKDTEFIRKTITNVLNGLKDKKDLFSPASLDIIFKNALVAVSESADLITKGNFLQKLIQETLGVLTKAEPKNFFTPATFAGIVEAALETVANNAGAIIKLAGPEGIPGGWANCSYDKFRNHFGGRAFKSNLFLQAIAGLDPCGLWNRSSALGSAPRWI